MEHEKLRYCNTCKKKTIHLYKSNLCICKRCNNCIVEKNENGKSIKEYTLWLAREKLNYDMTEEEADDLMLSFGFEHNQRV